MGACKIGYLKKSEIRITLPSYPVHDYKVKEDVFNPDNYGEEEFGPDDPKAKFSYQLGSFQIQGYRDAPNAKFRYHFSLKAAQILQMASFGAVLNQFGSKAAQMLQMIRSIFGSQGCREGIV